MEHTEPESPSSPSIPKKRQKFSAINATTITDLPNEVLFNIFLSIKDIECLIDVCAHVCRRWNSIIDSVVFFEALLRRELGSPSVDSFLTSYPGSNVLLEVKDFVTENALCTGGIAMQDSSPLYLMGGYDFSSKQKILEMIGKVDPSMERWHFEPYLCLGKFLSRYYRAQKHLDRIWLINFEQMLSPLPEVVTILRMPFLILGEHYAVTFYDADFGVLKSIVYDWKFYVNCSLLSGPFLRVPTDTRYLIIISHASSLRAQILFPSLASRVEVESQMHELDDFLY